MKYVGNNTGDSDDQVNEKSDEVSLIRKIWLPGQLVDAEKFAIEQEVFCTCQLQQLTLKAFCRVFREISRKIEKTFVTKI